MAFIHTTAIVDPKAIIEHGVEVGAYCIIGPNVKIGTGTKLHTSVVVEGWTTIGAKCEIFPYASIGGKPQDIGYAGEECYVEIGNDTTIREYVTINRGTPNGRKTTIVGDNCLLMACSHVAHDCVLGNGVILANAALLAGHVCVDDKAIVGGATVVHQFVNIGRNAMLGGMSKIIMDVLPYCMAGGCPTFVAGLNIVGLRRSQMSPAAISVLKKAYKLLYRSNLSQHEAILAIKQLDHVPELEVFLAAIAKASRGILKTRRDVKG